MKKLFLTSAISLILTLTTSATVWRVNNNNGINANFTEITSAISSASVLNGDTLYIEPSATAYNGFTLTKQLVIIGNGYYLAGAGSNPGLQASTNESSVGVFTLAAGSSGSKFLGITFSYFFFANVSGLGNYLFEHCRTNYGFFSAHTHPISNITFRKCVFDIYIQMNSTATTMTNFTIENCIINTSVAYNLILHFSSSSTALLFRNNTINAPYFSNITGFYVANNIFLGTTNNTFNSCIVKNNLFVFNQTGVTTGPLSTNGNNLVSQTRASLIVDTGSNDGKFQLAVGSPAIGGGVDIGGVKPSCGAFGGNDPYVLSGIPAIPSIYSFSFPNGNSVPLNSPSILINFSTRDNK